MDVIREGFLGVEGVVSREAVLRKASDVRRGGRATSSFCEKWDAMALAPHAVLAMESTAVASQLQGCCTLGRVDYLELVVGEEYSLSACVTHSNGELELERG